MQIKISFMRLLLLVLLLSLLLAACTTPAVPATPETLPEITEAPPTPTQAAPAPTSVTNETPDLRPIEVADVQVQIGEGSPVPFDVVVSGTWPGLCAQLVQVEQTVSEGRFDITLLASPEDPDCPPDMVGLPFRMAVPVNAVVLPANLYTLAVNGVETAIQWDFVSDSAGGSLDAPGAAEGDLIPIEVAEAHVEVGVGSPIPVDVVVSGTWPGLCSQLARIDQRFSDGRVEIELLATPSSAECPPDHVGDPFRITVPLNMVEAPLGEYTLLVNGFENTFEWTGVSPEPTSEQPGAGLPTIVYIGRDYNLWVLEPGVAEPRQLTQDASPPSSDSTDTAVSYNYPRISSDGRYVAVRRDAGTPISSGYQYEFGVWVYDLVGDEPLQIYDQLQSGLDWKPGTHLLAYSLGVDENYFATRGQPDSTLARGINGFDVDTGESSLLVGPERGLALSNPFWSPDGRFLSFDEVLYYEGRGPFAYYDFENGEYISLEQPLGSYDWSPDGNQIAYDYLTYTASGDERIYIRDRQAGNERQISPDFPNGGYAHHPVFSPHGDRIAYLAALDGPEHFNFNIYVQDLAGGEPRDLGRFDTVWNLYWTPDGTSLIFGAGQFQAEQVLQVDVADGALTELAQGRNPDMAGD